MKVLKMTCIHGHPMTFDNVSIEVDHNGVHNYRCKTCANLRKRKKYRTDPMQSRLQRAYSHWFKCGDPHGRIWPEVKAEIIRG